MILLFIPRHPKSISFMCKKTTEILFSFGFLLNEKKCQRNKTEIDYLGMHISDGKVRPTSDKLDAVLKMPVRSSKTELQSFLGLVNFYRGFSPHLAEVALPLYRLTHKNESFVWDVVHEQAFVRVKKLLTGSQILRIPDFELPFLLSTDASSVALGAVLSQEIDGNEYPIFFASRTLSDAERNYSVIEKELLAIVFAIKKFRCYLYGTTFKVYCDHNPLKHVATMRDPTKRIARWLMLLQDYRFQVHFRPGKLNSNADCLSRLPIVSSVSTPDMNYRMLLQNTPLPVDSPYALHRSNIVMEGGELWFQNSAKQRLKIPAPAARQRIIDQIHCLGHFGIKKTGRLLKELFWWPGMMGAVQSTVAQCGPCQRRKPRSKAEIETLPHVPIAVFHPMEVVAWDIMGPFPVSFSGMKYIVVVMDLFSRWVKLKALPDVKAATLANYLWTDFISCYGPPVRMHSDQGPNLNAAVLKQLYDIWGIAQSTTVAYYPQGNGMVERMNRVIQDVVAKKISEKGPQLWDELLPSVAFAHNITPHSETGVSPFSLFFGREPSVPVDGRVYRSSVSEDTKFEKLFTMWQTMRKRWQNVRNLRHFQLVIAFYCGGHALKVDTPRSFIHLGKDPIL